ncbi:hypothetical protein MYP_1363 [Sporocytophaga myxococcoides]|uniref:Uncharacterized protein n=1 Tax=Sporocytophaga myxococcoides TaxID=153721 RepID=A0A098LB36_9BACT|nr:hypothetical protein [Sporocytophaga myxococcoides]GAL84135.1 hypothetical protein MYP_1363 [Sporocytophaga myxococcoides]
MKNNIVIGLMITLSLGWGGATQTFAYSQKEASEVSPLKGPKKMKKNLFKRKKKRYKNNTVVKIKRSGKGPNRGRRNYSSNFR